MDSILAITYSFLLSFMPYHTLSLDMVQGEYYKNSTHVQFELGLDVKDMFRFYGGEETYQLPYPTIFSNYPYTQTYWIGAEFHKEFNDGFNLKFGVNHKCKHPLNCWNEQLSNSNEAYTEIYIDISGKIKVF